MARSGSLKSSATYEGRTITLSYYISSQDIKNNTSEVIWTLTVDGGEHAYYATGPIKVTINGQLVYYCDRTPATYTFPARRGNTSGPVTIKHAANGKQNINLELTAAVYTYATKTDRAVFELDPVPRTPSITSAPVFTDESNPKVNFNNLAGNNADSLILELLSEDGKTVFATRDIKDKMLTSYTFLLSDAERNALRNYSTTKNSFAVKFRITTVVGGDTLTHELRSTCNIVNANPVVKPTVTRTDANTKTLTGDDNTLIRYHSNVEYSFTSTAQKGSSITSNQVVNGSQNSENMTGSFNKVDSGTFTFYSRDTRGNVSAVNVSKPIVNYVLLTCDLEMNSPNTDGELDFRIFGNYWDGNFGAQQNTLTLQYRYNVNDGAFGSWLTVQPTIKSNSYSVDVKVTGLNYQNTYSFEARAVDKVGSVESNLFTTKTRPIFDWSENDFNFNCPVTITDGYLKYPLMGIINAMTKTYVCDVTTFAGDNYTVSNAGATICGNVLRCNFTAKRSSATGSGNITNETVCTISIAHGGKISGMLNTCFGNGANGHVASFLTSNVSQTADTLDFNVQVSATGGSTNEFSTYFLIPITINLDKFVEETA